MAHTLPELGFDYGDLEPHIDKETMKRHHTKNHQAYINKLNAALESHSELQNKSAEELIKDLNAIPEDIRKAVQNHGGGHANHSFFWKILQKDGANAFGDCEEAINKKFGSYDKFKEEFTNAAMSLFGSGWVWLVTDSSKELEIITTPNQDSPISQGKNPIIGLDMWEHSFVKQYLADKGAYIEAFFSVINWDQANENLANA